MRLTRGVLTLTKLAQNWPWDFEANGSILNGRSNWGPAYNGQGNFTGIDSLVGGKGLPPFVDPCLPLTYTSSNKIMPQGTSSTVRTAPRKREASEEVKKNDNNTSKKICLGDESSPTTKKNIALKGSHNTVEEISYTEPKNTAIKEALTHFDTLTASVRQSQKKVLELEAQLSKNSLDLDKEWQKTYDSLHDEWETCYQRQKEEVTKLQAELEDHNARLGVRNTRILDLERRCKELKPNQARVEELERAIKARDGELTQTKKQWSEAQEILDKANKELGKLSKVSVQVPARPERVLFSSCRGDSGPNKLGISRKNLHGR